MTMTGNYVVVVVGGGPAGSTVAAFVELVGGLASGDNGVLTTESLDTRWNAASADFSEAVQSLATVDNRKNQLFRSKSNGRTFHVGRQLLEEAQTGRSSLPFYDTSAILGGLAVAKDGLAWTES